MPRNFDAFALFLIVMFVLMAGFFEDHGPWCFRGGPRVGVVDDSGFMIVAPHAPAPPALPKLPALPALPRL